MLGLSWKEDKWMILFCSFLFLVIVVLVTVAIWFRATHTCVRYDEHFSDTYCAMYTTIYTGKNTTQTICTMHKPCRPCLEWVEDESPRAKDAPLKPRGACP